MEIAPRPPAPLFRGAPYMPKKNIPYDQKYYDPEIETMPREELESSSSSV